MLDIRLQLVSIAQNYFYTSIFRFVNAKDTHGYFIRIVFRVTCILLIGPSYFILSNDRITLLYPTRFVRVFFVAFMNRVDIKISSKLVPIRILLERRRNESVHRECDERVRRALRNRGRRTRKMVCSEKRKSAARPVRVAGGWRQNRAWNWRVSSSSRFERSFSRLIETGSRIGRSLTLA